MARLKIADMTNSPWLSSASSDEIDPDSESYGLGTEADDTERAVRVHHPGGPSELQMFEVRMPPGDQVESHAHDADEIIFVVEGELRLGARVIKAGSSALVLGGTLYTFVAGDEGLRFLNFRAYRDLSYYTREQLMAARRGDEPQIAGAAVAP